MENDIEWINPAERLPQAGQKVIARDMVNGIKICTFIVARGVSLGGNWEDKRQIGERNRLDTMEGLRWNNITTGRSAQ